MNREQGGMTLREVDPPLFLRKFEPEPPDVPAPPACSACGAETAAKNRRGEAAFRCGSTTTSLREGFTICVKPREDRPRETALYRQHLRRAGTSDPMV